jgi:hypothetical protein
LLAYRKIAKSTDARRAVLSVPASYNDLLHALLLSRGVAPEDAVVANASNPSPRAPERRVNVVGGKWTRSAEMMGQQWAKANMQNDWARQTDSNAAAIAWSLDSDA